MPSARIERSLFFGAGALTLAYGALWWVLGSARATAPAPDVLAGTAYAVTTPNGDVHVLATDSPDPARPLVEATERFGQNVSLRRVSPEEAADILRRQRSAHHVVLVLLLFPVAFLVAGARVRRRGRTLATVFDAIAPSLSEEISTLSRRTGLEEQALRAEVERIRRRGLANLVWDDERGRVYDERLSSHSLLLQTCPHCSDPIVARMRADLANIPQCPSCMTTFDAAVLARMNRDLVERLRAEPIPAGADAPFSPGAFALWTLLFPPAALVHALRAAG